jgi:hypothetical protein
VTGTPFGRGRAEPIGEFFGRGATNSPSHDERRVEWRVLLMWGDELAIVRHRPVSDRQHDQGVRGS